MGKQRETGRNGFQAKVKEELETRLPGAIITKSDPTFKQGTPDLDIKYGTRWAALECKRSEDAPHRPNQDKRVQIMDSMSFSSFIFPENKNEVLDRVEKYLKEGVK